MATQITINPETVIAAYEAAFEGVDELITTEVLEERRLKGTHITAEIWNDTINGLRKICATLIENVTAHREGTEDCLAIFAKDISDFLTDALAHFGTEFTEWLREIQYFNVEELGDGVTEYYLHFTFGTQEDPEKYGFCTDNLIAYNQIWVTTDADGNPNPPPQIPKRDERGNLCYDAQGKIIYEDCWVIKIDPNTSDVNAPITFATLEALLGRTALEDGEDTVFKTLTDLKTILGFSDLLTKYNADNLTLATKFFNLENNVGTWSDSARSETVKAAIESAERTLQNVLEALNKIENLDDIADCANLNTQINDIKDVLGFVDAFEDYTTHKKDPAWARLDDLEAKLADAKTELKNVDASLREVIAIAAANEQNLNTLQTDVTNIQKQCEDSGWQSANLEISDWGYGSFISYRKHHGLVDLRFWIYSARSFSDLAINADHSMFVIRLPEEYRPDTDCNPVCVAHFETQDAVDQGTAFVEIVSGDQAMTFVNIYENNSTWSASDTDGSFVVRNLMCGNTACRWYKNTVLWGQITYLARE